MKAAGIAKKLKKNGSSAGQQVTNAVKNIIATKMKLSLLAPVIVPVASIIVIFLIVSSMFGEKLSLFQMVDPNNASG